MCRSKASGPDVVCFRESRFILSSMVYILQNGNLNFFRLLTCQDPDACAHESTSSEGKSNAKFS
ncbi:hypothetical protein J6590_072581 [Homalodisca vitripennis]|nr:hypothetical protein J6590_072581 [Homalodisca vitripennis]